WTRSAVARWQRVLRNEIPPKFDVRTGLAALDQLHKRFADRDLCPTHKSDSWRCLVRLVESIIARRRAAATSLASPACPAIADPPTASADAIAALSPTSRARETWTSTASRHDLIAKIDLIRAADRAILAALG